MHISDTGPWKPWSSSQNASSLSESWCLVWNQCKLNSGVESVQIEYLALFFMGTVNLEIYINLILNTFFRELIKEEGLYGWFQHDFTMAHIAYNSMSQ
jgi:hypothetical protein